MTAENEATNAAEKILAELNGDQDAPEESPDIFDAALGRAYSAAKDSDEAAFKRALAAAITIKVSEEGH